MLSRLKLCPTTPVFFRQLASYEPCDTGCPSEEPKKQDPIYRAPKSVKVAVINSASNVGKTTNLLLKQDPLIKELRMYCLGSTIGLQTDLKSIPTTTRGFAFTGKSLDMALKGADIVFLVGAKEPDDVSTDEEVFIQNQGYIKNIATAVAKHCPEAVVGISVYPINSTVPLFGEIMRQHGVFCPNKVLGVMSLFTMRARSVIACILGINPATVKVNVSGGGTPNTIVPLISSVHPAGHCLMPRADEISLGIANMNAAVWAMNKHQAWLSAAHSNASFVHEVARGLTGNESKGVAFLRNNQLYGLSYSAQPAEFGLSGVTAIDKMPKMSRAEIARFDSAIPYLHNDIELGIKAAHSQITTQTNSQCNEPVKVCRA